MFRPYYVAPPPPQALALGVLTNRTYPLRIVATLDAVTMASAGLITIEGVIAPTLGNVTMEAAGAIALEGTITATLGNVTMAAAGALATSFSAVLGTGGPIGSLAIAAAPLAGNALSGAVGQAVGTGVVNVTLGAVTMFATADLDEKNARIVVTLGDVTMAGIGTVTAPVNGIWTSILPTTDIWTPIAPDTDDIWTPIAPDTDDTWSAAA